MKWKRLLAGMLSAVMLVTGFTACSGEKTESPEKRAKSGETAVEGEAVEKIQLLTHVFRGEELVLPEGLERVTGVDVLHTASGRLMLCCTGTSEAGMIQNYICEMDFDGGNPVLTEIVLEENASIIRGAFTETMMVFVTSVRNEESGEYTWKLYTYQLADGTCEIIENVKELRPEKYLELSGVQADDAGNIYLATPNSCCVLNPEGTRIIDQSFTSVKGLKKDEEGKVYLTGYLDNINGSSGRDIMRINPETKSLEPVCTLPPENEAKDCYVGPGYDVYYANPVGLYGYNTGMQNGELVLNWENSGLSMESVNKIQVLSPDTMLIVYNDLSELRTVSSIFRKSSDIDLSQIVTVEIAFVGEEERFFSDAVAQFNKTHDNIRVVVRDYSQYNTEENKTGGETRLMNDILNGLYKPDIISSTGNDRILSTMIEKRMFIDLYPFMDEGDKVQKDDLFGCIKTTLEVDGQLSALCRSFSVNTLLARKDTVGDKTSWTLSEMLDLAESLGEDQYMMSYLKPDNAVSSLLGANSYDQFIDMKNKTCDFDDPTFIRLLSYIASIAKKGMYTSGQKMYEGTQTGKVMLHWWFCYNMRAPQFNPVPFNTPDVVKIGFPTSGGEGSGSIVTFSEHSRVYLIPTVSEHPEEAWEFLSDYVGTENLISASGYSPLKSLFYEYAKNEEGSKTFFGFEGHTSSWSGNVGYEVVYGEDGTARLNGQPGILTEFSWDKLDEFAAWLDTVGTPIGETIPAEVTAIIEEEISSFIGGAKSAEDTAKVIQSRVSLWLAEHE